MTHPGLASSRPDTSARGAAAESGGASRCSPGVLSLDPRTKLFFLLVANVLLFLHCKPAVELVIVGLVLSAYLMSGHMRAALAWCAVYLGMFACDQLCTPIAEANFALRVASVLSGSLRIMVPCLIAGAYAFTTTSPSEFAAALRRLRVPEGGVIPVLVVMRYFPTLRRELSDIADAMRLRGIGTSPRDVLAHPRSSVEHVLVPLLASASSTAEDLSQACLTKGADNPGPRTCLTRLRLRAPDVLYMVAAVALLALQVALG